MPCIRYADDIVLLAKSKRASEALLENSTEKLEEKLKHSEPETKTYTLNVFQSENLSFLALHWEGTEVAFISQGFIEVWKKFKSRLKELSSRRSCQSIKPSLEKIKVYVRGGLTITVLRA